MERKENKVKLILSFVDKMNVNYEKNFCMWCEVGSCMECMNNTYINVK